MRSLRGDSSTQGAGADLNATLTYMTKNMYPGQDRYLWDNRYNAIKELTKELAKVVVQNWLSRQTEEAGSDQEQEPEPGQEEARDDDATIVDFSPTGVPDQDFADPLETVQTFERTDQALFLDECKVDNYKWATITSSRQGQDA